MAELRPGNREAAGEVIELWPDLRRVAAAKAGRERTDHTLQPLLEPVNAGAPDTHPHRGDNNAVIGLDAHVMIRLLRHPARPLHRAARRVPVDEHGSGPKQEPGPRTMPIERLRGAGHLPGAG